MAERELYPLDARAAVDQQRGEVVAKGVQARTLRNARLARRRCPDQRPGRTVDRTALDRGEDQASDTSMVLALVWVGTIQISTSTGGYVSMCRASAAITTAGISMVRTDVFVLGGPR